MSKKIKVDLGLLFLLYRGGGGAFWSCDQNNLYIFWPTYCKESSMPNGCEKTVLIYLWDSNMSDLDL